MKPLLIYIYACIYPGIRKYSERFVYTFKTCPPEHDYRLCVVVNGGNITDEIVNRFNGIDCEFVQDSNRGWDIGAYIRIAEDPSFLSEAMVCCGSSTHFKKPGWLKRMCSVWSDLGPNLYGVHGSYEVRPHIRTATGLMLPPFMLIYYPYKPITSRSDRYHFEHGEKSITWFAEALKHKAIVISWTGIHEMKQWPGIKNGYRNGNQSNCLAYDRLSDAYRL